MTRTNILMILSLLVVGGCADVPTPAPSTSSADISRTNQIPQGPREDDPLLLNTLSCKWRDEVGVPAWIQEHCPNGVKACLKALAATQSAISTLRNQRNVFLQDVGYPPYYVTYDAPQRWCQPSEKHPGS